MPWLYYIFGLFFHAIQLAKQDVFCVRGCMYISECEHQFKCCMFSETWILPILVLLAMVVYADIALFFFYHWLILRTNVLKFCHYHSSRGSIIDTMKNTIRKIMYFWQNVCQYHCLGVCKKYSIIRDQVGRKSRPGGEVQEVLEAMRQWGVVG